MLSLKIVIQKKIRKNKLSGTNFKFKILHCYKKTALHKCRAEIYKRKKEK